MDDNTSLGEILIYQTEDGTVSIEVKLEKETVWLTQSQLCALFERDKSVISRHIRNIFEEGELQRESTVAKKATVVQRGFRGATSEFLEYYNLDVIISLGYRVRSHRATSFRIWASSVLKEYLVKGYAVRQQLIESRYLELKQLVQVLGRTVRSEALSDDQTRSILDVVVDYSYGLDTLDSYDYQRLSVSHTTNEEKFQMTFDTAIEVIETLRNKFDGNKRIAATLFLWFLENNGILYHLDGTKRIADNALVALTLLIAESKTDEMDIMVKVVVNLINQNN